MPSILSSRAPLRFFTRYPSPMKSSPSPSTATKIPCATASFAKSTPAQVSVPVTRSPIHSNRCTIGAVTHFTGLNGFS